MKGSYEMADTGSNDETGKEGNKVHKGIWLIGWSTLVFVLSAASHFFFPLPKYTHSDSILRFLEQAPTDWKHYVCLLALLGMYAGWKWCQYAEIDNRHEESKRDSGSNLNAADWRIIREFRQRAFNLRIRADILLAGVFVLLFGGIYFTIFIVPEIPGSDERIQRKASFVERFGSVFQSIADGQYWLRIADQNAGLENKQECSEKLLEMEFGERITAQSFNDDCTQGIIGTNWGDVHVLIEGNDDWSRPDGLRRKPAESLAVATFSADGPRGIAVGDKGSVFVTMDSGATWKRSADLETRVDELLVTAAVFSSDSLRGVVGGAEGSVFVTTDGGTTWKRPEGLDMKTSERVTTAALSAKGQNGLVGGAEGSVFVTTDGGTTWKRPEGLDMKTSERVTTAALSAKGQNGLVGGAEGSVFVTTDGGVTWKRPEGLDMKTGEWATAVTFSIDGSKGVVVGDDGSVFVTTGGGETWKRQADLEMKDDELVEAAAFSATGLSGLVGGDKGSIFLTMDSGVVWKRPEGLEMDANERVTAAAFSTDGQVGMAGGSKGSVFVTEDGGKTWGRPVEMLEMEAVQVLGIAGLSGLVGEDKGSVSLTIGGEGWTSSADLDMKHEWVIAAALSTDGHGMVVVGRGGSVFVTANGGKNWTTSEDLNMKTNELTTVAAFSLDVQHGVVGGSKGSVFVTANGGKNWTTSKDLNMKTNELTTVAAFSLDVQHGVVGGNKGSVFVTTDGGQTWKSPMDLNMEANESVTVADFSADGLLGVVGGSKGSAFVTTDGGKRWTRAKPDEPAIVFKSIWWTSSTDNQGYFNGTNEEGRTYYLKIHPGLVGWRGWSLPNIKTKWNQQKIQDDSEPIADITTFLNDEPSASAGKTDNGNRDGIFEFDKVDLERIATLTLLFFLVQLLSRLYQYSFRLSAFWESRADAVILASSFTISYKNPGFDGLVSALAPDAYDFRPMSSSLLGSLVGRRTP